jgi:hypothetical protein
MSASLRRALRARKKPTHARLRSFNLTKVPKLSSRRNYASTAQLLPRYFVCAGIGKSLTNDTQLGHDQPLDEGHGSFERQTPYWCDIMISCINKKDAVQQRLKPLPYLSFEAMTASTGV